MSFWDKDITKLMIELPQEYIDLLKVIALIPICFGGAALLILSIGYIIEGICELNFWIKGKNHD